MESKTEHTKSSRWKWLGIGMGILLGIIVLGRVALMTGPVHRWVKNTIVSSAESALTPQLSIGDISGDLWSEATLVNVQLTESDSTVAAIDTLYIEYNPLSYFGDAFQIQTLNLSRPYIHIAQAQDSTWNVEHWLRADSSETDTAGAFAFSVADISVAEGKAQVKAPSLGKDTPLEIDDLTVAGSVGYAAENYHIELKDFSFALKNTRLDSAIAFEAKGRADESTLSLDKLAIATGHSLLEAAGKADVQDSTANVTMEASPLGWRDMAAYVQDVQIQKDLDMKLSLKGSVNDFKLNYSIQGEGIQQLDMTGHFQREEVLTMTSFRAEAQNVDAATLLADTTMPALGHIEITADGALPIAQHQEASLQGTILASDLRQSTYQLDQLEGNFELDEHDLSLRLEPVNAGERVVAELRASQVWSPTPSVSAQVSGSEISLSEWIGEEEYQGQLTFNGNIRGEGWFPDKEYWHYQVSVEESRLLDQQIDQAIFRGMVSGTSITNSSQIAIKNGRLKLEAEVQQLQDMPTFTYTLDTKNVDLSKIRGMEQYPSSITATIQGEGYGRSLQTLQMNATAAIDSSIFRGERIESFTADLGLVDSVVTISEAGLESGIADGKFRGRIHLGNLYDTNNSLDIDLQLKDISSFAAIAGVKILQAEGDLTGQIVPLARDSAAFKGKVDLKKVNYDSLFIAPNISGGLRVDLAQTPRFVADVNIEDPTVASVDLQNIRLNTEGQVKDSEADGSFTLSLSGSDEDRIVQAGQYGISEEEASVNLSRFDLSTALRTLSLQKSFQIEYSNGAIQTDTLHLSSPDKQAFMELAIPYADSLRQEFFLKAEKLNLQAIQDATLETTYLQGMLSGDIRLDRTDTTLNASTDVVMSDLLYQDTELDTLQLQADIANDRLKGTMELHQAGDLIAEGDLDIPFKAQNPNTLEENFFTKPVSGDLALHAVKLSRFNTLLQQLGYEKMKGTLQFNGRLEGEAGNPKMSAELRLDEARLSEVPIDSFIASADYKHSASELHLHAGLTSLGQKALDVDATMPLEVDLRTFDVALPEPQDRISVDVQTDDFNLKALNNFLDRTTMRDLAGRVDGKVAIHGPRNDLRTSGHINLSKGALRVVPVGIRLDHIASTVQFKEDKVSLANLRMESGSGYLTSKGEVMLEQLRPGDIDFSVTAENFKVANTEEYNGIIDLNMDVSGSVSKPSIEGKLSVINGFVELDNFGEKSVEEVSLDTSKVFEPEASVYDSLRLEMDVAFNRRFFVRNQRYLEMELEMDGQVDLLKESGEDLQLFGTLNTADGYAEPLGKRFELEEGSLAFSGPPDNPQINVRTLYEPQQADQDLKIWYIIEGNVEDPQFKYESDPPMDFAGILSYTLFGQPFYKLNPAEQSVASSSSSNTAADFAMEVLLDRVESMATRRLGIDVVRIENTRVGGESGTSVTTGWYINPKVFFAIQNVITGSTPTTGFYLEYYLKKNLKLILSQGNDNRQGIDIQWEHDY